jgi:hypothetical protein
MSGQRPGMPMDNQFRPPIPNQHMMPLNMNQPGFANNDPMMNHRMEPGMAPPNYYPDQHPDHQFGFQNREQQFREPPMHDDFRRPDFNMPPNGDHMYGNMPGQNGQIPLRNPNSGRPLMNPNKSKNYKLFINSDWSIKREKIFSKVKNRYSSPSSPKCSCR